MFFINVGLVVELCAYQSRELRCRFGMAVQFSLLAASSPSVERGILALHHLGRVLIID